MKSECVNIGGKICEELSLAHDRIDALMDENDSLRDDLRIIAALGGLSEKQQELVTRAIKGSSK